MQKSMWHGLLWLLSVSGTCPEETRKEGRRVLIHLNLLSFIFLSPQHQAYLTWTWLFKAEGMSFIFFPHAPGTEPTGKSMGKPGSPSDPYW